MNGELCNVNDVELVEILEQDQGVAAIAFMEYKSIPCEHFLPELVSFAHTFRKYIYTGRLDTLENPEITQKLNVLAVPTLVIYQDGRELARYEGPYSREALCERIRKLLDLKERK